MSTIKSVCFDLDGVYFTPESFQRFKKALSGNNSEDVIEHVFHKSDEILNFKKGLISENEYWDYVRKSLKISMPNEEIFQALRDAYEVNEEIVDLVKKVKEKGLQTCICSNNFETRIRELNSKFDFLKNFDVQIFSYKVGVAKPDKEIFQSLVDACGVNPDEIVFSDDSPEKLSGANELGIKTFVFEGVPSFINKLKELEVL